MKHILISCLLLIIIINVQCYKCKMTLVNSPIKAKDYIYKGIVKAAAIIPLTLSAIKVSNAKVLTEEERQLQQNQRPEKYDESPTFNGNAPDYKSVAKDIAEIISNKPDKGPTFVRLAWHSSGTYDRISKTGGSQKGTIRFNEELSHGANAGLDLAVSWLEPIYKKYNKNYDLSYADLYTLAGVVAIKTLGGPTISWKAGRQDSFDLKDVTPDGRLPDADKGNSQDTANHIRSIFGRMGFDDQEIVALSGAHALGRCHATASGYVGPWSPSPTTFNNLYYTLLLGVKWTVNPKTSKLQYEDPSKKLMMLPSDLTLIEDVQFKKIVEIYSKDQKRFFNDFSLAFQKLEELGTSNLISVKWS